VNHSFDALDFHFSVINSSVLISVAAHWAAPQFKKRKDRKIDDRKMPAAIPAGSDRTTVTPGKQL
jgi:hypothetical protein